MKQFIYKMLLTLIMVLVLGALFKIAYGYSPNLDDVFPWVLSFICALICNPIARIILKLSEKTEQSEVNNT